MKRTVLFLAVLAAGTAAAFWIPAPASAGVADLVEQAREKLGPVLLARDLLVEPGRDVTLEASLRSGLRLTGMEGKRLQFLLAAQVLGNVRTNSGGDVAIRWTVPAKPGDYRVTVRVHPQDQPPQPIPDAELLVAARPADTPLVVVDLDKTLVASGFAWVLLGEAKPMSGASAVLGRLAKDHAIVYLTHRPDFLGPSSKKWLAANGFPPGPVLTSTLGGLVAGSGAYKSGQLEAIRQTFKNLAVGIGDKFSDAKAYADNNLQSILILQVNWADTDPEHYEKLANELAALPGSVQVVANWSQVAAILFEKAHCPKDEMEKRLRQLALELRRQHKD